MLNICLVFHQKSSSAAYKGYAYKRKKHVLQKMYIINVTFQLLLLWHYSFSLQYYNVSLLQVLLELLSFFDSAISCLLKVYSICLKKSFSS